jgi:D-alanine transaminase
MSDLLWLNSEVLPFAEARINVEDRGFQFADGVYEVIRIYNGKPFTLAEHLVRLKNSADGIRLALPMDGAALAGEILKFIPRAGVKEGMIYLQVTRGVAPRNHIFPATGQTMLFYMRPLPPVPEPGTGEGVKLLAVPDERWKRCWIKSIALLPNVLAKNQAIAAEADEAVFIEGDIVTECSASTLFAVIGRRLVTHPVGSKVLPGVTRSQLLELASGVGLEVDERPFREEEARRADELFITSTTREVSWVARWNDRYIGQARCGTWTKKLHQALRDKVNREIA